LTTKQRVDDEETRKMSVLI